MTKSKIEWTDRTWNPVRGCSRVSEGCRNCYAERQAARFVGPGEPFHGFAKVTAPRDSLDRTGGRRNGWTGKVALVPEKLREPLLWKKPARVFVNSMSDLFHEGLPDEAIDQVFAVMALARQHTFQVLTKRADRMRAWAESRSRRTKHISDAGIRLIEENGWCVEERWEGCFPTRNVHLGVSVEDQATADARIPVLLDTPAAVRFVSYEPALGPVRLLDAWVGWGGVVSSGGGPAPFQKGDRVCVKHGREIDWLIVGGESGPGARPCDVAWVRSIVGQCRDALVPCFVKQLGAHPVDYPTVAHQVRGGAADGQRFTSRKVYDPDDSPPRLFLSDRKGGDPLEWDSDLRVREFPRCA